MRTAETETPMACTMCDIPDDKASCRHIKPFPNRMMVNSPMPLGKSFPAIYICSMQASHCKLLYESFLTLEVPMAVHAFSGCNPESRGLLSLHPMTIGLVIISSAHSNNNSFGSDTLAQDCVQFLKTWRGCRSVLPSSAPCSGRIA